MKYNFSHLSMVQIFIYFNNNWVCESFYIKLLFFVEFDFLYFNIFKSFAYSINFEIKIFENYFLKNSKFLILFFGRRYSQTLWIILQIFVDLTKINKV